MTTGYTEAALQDLNLPGFGELATLDEALEPSADWRHELSVAFFVKDPLRPDNLGLLTVIRKADDESETDIITVPHQDVSRESVTNVSTRSRSSIADSASRSFQLSTKINFENYHVVTGFAPNPRSLPDPDDPLVDAVDRLIDTTLGGNAPQQGDSSRPFTSVSLGAIVIGFSSVGEDDASGEALWKPALLYACIGLVATPDVLPRETAVNRNIGFTAAYCAIEPTTYKLPDLIVPSLDFEDYLLCIKGLEWEATRHLIRQPDLHAHLGLTEIAST